MGVDTNPEHRIGVFIDIQNLYHSAKHLHGSRVNYRELLKHLTAGRHLIRTMAYVVTSDPQTGEVAFFEALEKEGIELRNKELQTFSSGAKKADWDVGMAVDIIRLAHGFDVVVIATGDGDFIPLVEYLQSGMGKIVEVAAFARTASGKLREQADKFIDIDSIPKIIFKTEKSRRRVLPKKTNA